MLFAVDVIDIESLGRRNPLGPQSNLQLRRLIVERQAAPDILLSGLVTPEDVTALFEMCVPAPYLYLAPCHRVAVVGTLTTRALH